MADIGRARQTLRPTSLGGPLGRAGARAERPWGVTWTDTVWLESVEKDLEPRLSGAVAATSRHWPQLLGPAAASAARSFPSWGASSQDRDAGHGRRWSVAEMRASWGQLCLGWGRQFWA